MPHVDLLAKVSSCPSRRIKANACFFALMELLTSLWDRKSCSRRALTGGARQGAKKHGAGRTFSGNGGVKACGMPQQA